MHLPDVNFWLALAFEVHAHHKSAKAWFVLRPSGSCAFCRLTQLGFLRLSTNRSVFGDETLTMGKAWKCYDQLLRDDRIRFWQESPGLDGLLPKHTEGRKYSHKVWSDAYLVAFAQASELTVVTFDKGFRDYTGVDRSLLEP